MMEKCRNKSGLLHHQYQQCHCQKEDGSKFEKAYIKSNNATTSVPNTLIHKQSEYGWALPGKTSVAGKSFAADFEVKPVINSQMKKIEGEAELDGLATLTFQFGI
ncbi:hypothetical protein I3679_020220 [Proteus mirabilis]|uniref:Fimbrial subunit n=1 Tax=Proteus mirabilis TaxID=584 RepID=A0ABD5LV77_PROMI